MLKVWKVPILKKNIYRDNLLMIDSIMQLRYTRGTIMFIYLF